MKPLNVRALESSQVAAAGAALARGFHDDPLSVYMIPDAATRASALPAHFGAFVRLGQLCGVVLSTAGEPLGAAVWFGPGKWEDSPAELEEAGVAALASELPGGAFARFEAVTSYLDRLHRRDVSSDHWYLAILGVDAPRQGQGIGGALIAPVLERADAERLPCYLETVGPRNVPFYKRHGFEVVVEGVEPSSGLRFWTLRRDPQ